MPVSTRCKALTWQLRGTVASSMLATVGGLQPPHQSFLNNVHWKEVSILVIGQFEVVLLPWLGGIRSAGQITFA